MQVDVSFFNVRVFDVNRVDVLTGAEFELKTDHTGESLWFSNNDPVLEITIEGNNASLKALTPGSSTILIMSAEKQVLKELTINVMNEIVPFADTLGATAGTPISKVPPNREPGQ